MLAKGLEPSTIRLQGGRSTIELSQLKILKNHSHIVFFLSSCLRLNFITKEADIPQVGSFGLGGAAMRLKRDDILLGPVRTSAVPIDLFAALDSQHFLNFFPEPQGHGSFRPGLSPGLSIGIS